MRLLLDTHVVLWQLSGDRTLAESARAAIAAADDLLFSSVSYAEVGVKAAIGKLDIPANFQAQVTDAGVRTLALTPSHGLAVATLPVNHRDPFDRLLIAQATVEGLSVVTADQRFQEYDLDVIEA